MRNKDLLELVKTFRGYGSINKQRQLEEKVRELQKLEKAISCQNDG